MNFLLHRILYVDFKKIFICASSWTYPILPQIPDFPFTKLNSPMPADLTPSGGLLRFPQFLREFILTIDDQQVHREADKNPSLLNPYLHIRDLWICVAIASIFLLLRVGVDTFVVPRIFKSRSARKLPKLSENMSYAVYYICTFVFYVTVVQPTAKFSFNLLSNQASVVRDFLHPFPPVMQASERLYYAQACGFYISATAFLVLFDSRRSDFSQMILHHFVTICLIIVSYVYSYVRVGLVVIALHDFGDIFLYSSKFVHHLGLSGYDTFLFSCFVVSFYITRLVMFPRIFHAVSVECFQTVVAEPGFNRWALYYDTYLRHYVVFVILLGTLLLLHCYWFALALRLVINQLVYGQKVSEVGDPRSDDEGDNDPVETFEDDEVDLKHRKD